MRAILVVLIAGGCTAWFDLAPTERDSDGDGIPNDRDTCPDVIDPEQTGEACDTCPEAMRSGRDIDQDGRDDGIGNVCDCVGEPSGTDDNGDGIDDGCYGCVGGASVVALDIDGDGQLDGCDTCIFQSGVDVDGDELDDQCDVCPAGPSGDEDGDGIEDWCDNCPVVANPDQAAGDVDLDTLGDACDPVLDRNHVRRLFDPFTSADRFSERWGAIPPAFAWESGTGRMKVTMGDGFARWESLEPITSVYALQLSARIAILGADPLRLGVLVVEAGMAPRHAISCGLSRTADASLNLSIRHYLDKQDITVDDVDKPVGEDVGPVDVHMTIDAQDLTGFRVTCATATAQITSRLLLGADVRVGLQAAGPPDIGSGVVEWIDAIEGLPLGR